MAVLFMDLVGFTTLSESLTPAETLALLTEVHDAMVEAVFAQDGSLDKFLGDGLMATFGTLEGESRQGPRAVGAALAMRAGLARVNSARAERGESPLAMRVGIHLGPAIVGNVGSRNRLEFTAIGDTVNTASRIESACKELGEDLLLSGTVASTLDIDLRSCGRIQLRGKAEPLELFAPSS